MKKLFTNFGKLLFIITIIVVLAFQGYWIWINFQNKREEILSKTKSEATQILLQNMLNQYDINDKLIKQKNPNVKVHVKFEVYLSQSDSKKIVNKQLKPQKGVLYDEKKISRLLYESLRYNLKKSLKREVQIHLYAENKTVKKTYPANQKITNQNTTEHINSLLQDNTTYRIHIVNMTEIIIYEIKEIIIFSIFYILLFLVTILLLLRNLNLSHKLLKNKEVFTRNMTHELKIPISTITIAAEGLEHYDVAEEPESVRKYANTIQRATVQLSSLVDTILQYTRADNNNEELILERINLVFLLQEVESDLSGIILKKHAEITFKDIDSNMTVKGNFNQLKQIFSNLIDNSLKYSEKAPHIIITAERHNHIILIRIKDNGIGIPEKYMEEVFTPYFRIVNDDTHDVKGFGLGLSFVKKSLKNQHGSIKVVNQKTEGTVMEIRIPAYE